MSFPTKVMCNILCNGEANSRCVHHFKISRISTRVGRKMYCEFVNSISSKYIVREDVKVGNGKKRTFFKVYFDKENAIKINDKSQA